jgi:drug/metabolite transporter (DMT)-like permease
MNTGPMPYIGEILALGTALAWAMAVIFFKRSGENVHPIALNLFKNILAFLLFIPTLFLFGEDLFYRATSSTYGILILSGALGIGIGDTLYFKSLNLLGAGLQAIISCMYAPSIITLSFIFLGESLSPIQIIGAILIISAVLTTVGMRNGRFISRRNLLLGILIGFLSISCTAISVVMIKDLLEQSPIMWLTTTRMTGGIFILILFLMMNPQRWKILNTLKRAGSRVYTLSGSLTGAYLAMVLWLAGMKYTQASTASALHQTSSIFIFILAAVILKEPITFWRSIGIILGVAGAIMVTFG